MTDEKYVGKFYCSVGAGIVYFLPKIVNMEKQY